MGLYHNPSFSSDEVSGLMSTRNLTMAKAQPISEFRDSDSDREMEGFS